MDYTGIKQALEHEHEELLKSVGWKRSNMTVVQKLKLDAIENEWDQYPKHYNTDLCMECGGISKITCNYH